MPKITENIEELRKILKEIHSKWEEATEFLDAIETQADDLKDQVITVEEDNASKDSRLSELEEIVENNEGLNTIDGGIGEITWTADNLALIDVMENLEAAIKKTTPRKVNEVLSNI